LPNATTTTKKSAINKDKHEIDQASSALVAQLRELEREQIEAEQRRTTLLEQINAQKMSSFDKEKEFNELSRMHEFEKEKEVMLQSEK
jgi:enoyl reductase-like protein